MKTIQMIRQLRAFYRTDQAIIKAISEHLKNSDMMIMKALELSLASEEFADLIYKPLMDKKCKATRDLIDKIVKGKK
jgi:hypothetical protein